MYSVDRAAGCGILVVQEVSTNQRDPIAQNQEQLNMATFVEGDHATGGVVKQRLQVMDAARIEVDVGPTSYWIHVQFGVYPDCATLTVTKATAKRLAALLVTALASHGPTAVASDGTPYDPDEECDLQPVDDHGIGGEG